MKLQKLLVRTCGAMLLALPLFAQAAAVPGQPAPAFSVKDAKGETHELKDYAGQWLVLEWFNKDCPFVKKHYVLSDNIPKTQAAAIAKGAKWLTVISSAEGKQGYLTPSQALDVAKEYKLGASAPFLLDASGDVGRAYGAKTTPHIFIVDPKGTVVYAGAIDSDSSANPASIAGATNYATTALAEAQAGQPVTTPATQAYGCTVKYAE
ncbi:redoxin domain-containing protein [Flavobacterium sp. MXW15]|uniref:Redoxin domain-containing protein n=1 Tax=Xanthomonas chitinilytica TaxID=2989819 RepID=A0ABT3JW28_9XANT|nr:redoxin domain-containing protein [Xanthomonas sp. H13-6]MCW4455163.1 redoxin domain-containing protein [Flavobacterium sp. MXW15]MCW4472671.1 redoxin domain-containing protein [Xanthomonas sp. H13-6]